MVKMRRRREEVFDAKVALSPIFCRRTFVIDRAGRCVAPILVMISSSFKMVETTNLLIIHPIIPLFHTFRVHLTALVHEHASQRDHIPLLAQGPFAFGN